MEYFTHPGEERKRRGFCGKICFDKKSAQTKKNFRKIGKRKIEGLQLSKL